MPTNRAATLKQTDQSSYDLLVRLHSQYFKALLFRTAVQEMEQSQRVPRLQAKMCPAPGTRYTSAVNFFSIHLSSAVLLQV